MGKGIRKSFWLPKSDYWIFRVIKRLILEFEQKGVRLTEGELIRKALIEYYTIRMEAEDFDVGDGEDPGEDS